ncbi:maltase 2-like isoform X1 [Drosophila sulfurigaster albostrigata]|uniref:maltase 2-like isoform X1 n=2 Tax=Drosophila sulfurigaster albostrigata TaxID=89887 RepID=UPI002D21C6D1|nr:maltase 2-like isoform X1 [Drosophila sulfurigaster albostrigata]
MSTLQQQTQLLLLCSLLLIRAPAPSMSSLLSTETDDFIDWWQHAVFYQIYPRSFKDSNGDGIGDLQGIISKLPYLAETGITATWLSPIFQSPMVDFGYDISDYRSIQSEYGSMSDFEQLVHTATTLGIKIVLDFVPNHSSDQHEWFKKSVAKEPGYEDFYIWSDGKLDEDGKRQPPNNWQSVFYGSAWEWNEEREQYYLHQFTKEQPDLNFRNAAVVQAMDDVMLYWLQKGVAGFRIDAVNHLFESETLADEPLSGKSTDPLSYDYTRHIYTKDLPEVLDMVQHWRQLLDDYTAKHPAGGARIMMTEAYAGLRELADYYEDANGVRGSHLPFNFNFITNVNGESDARDFVYNVEKWLVYMPRGHAANWVMGNHDNPRVATRFGADSVDAMNMLLMTLPGVAVTYNGEELGMEDNKEISWEETVDPPARNAGELDFQKVSRDPARTPFQWSSARNAGFSDAPRTWLPVNPNYVQLNLQSQQLAKKSHYKVYKLLIELRKLPVLRRGRFSIEPLSRAVFAIKRSLKDYNTFVTIINVSDKEQIVNLTDFINRPQQLIVAVAGVDSTYEPGDYSNRNGSQQLLLPPNAGIVLWQQDAIMSAQRRQLVKQLIKSFNVVLVALLMYNLWRHKWTKVNFN